MAVIVKTEATIGGKKFKNVKEYRSDKFVTEADKQKALKLDEYIAQTMKEAIAAAKKQRLLTLRGKSGCLDLWYFVGQRLKFVDDTTIVSPEDRKYIWRALWDHAGELAPDGMNSRSGTLRDHFKYCYQYE